MDTELGRARTSPRHAARAYARAARRERGAPRRAGAGAAAQSRPSRSASSRPLRASTPSSRAFPPNEPAAHTCGQGRPGATLDVTILGREFTVACEEAERADLNEAVAYLDGRCATSAIAAR
jgi:hypothetical protein